MSRVIVVAGPTASGKSAVAVALALHYRCPILSADSRQFYREMTIGTAVPPADSIAAATHYFIQDRSLNEPLSAGGYQDEALARLTQIFADDGHTAIVVGGSGLYIDALLYGFDALPSSAAIREELNAIYAKSGLEPILAGLLVADPAHYNIVDKSNPMRVIRALEVCRTSGMPYSKLRTGIKCNRDFDVVKIAVNLPRAELYKRIDNRVDAMVAAGLEDEARSVVEFRESTTLKTVGYSEFFDYFDGKISHQRAVELIKQNSRNYAKRQLTWLRRDKNLNYFEPDNLPAIIDYIDGHI